MLFNAKSFASLALGVVVFAGAQARAAQNTAQHSDQLPPARSSHEPLPTAPTPIGAGDVTLLKQAGIGSSVSYARAGVLELGGGLTFVGSNRDRFLAFTPTVGWFFTDNIELSAIVMGAYARSQGGPYTFHVTGLVEPSVHIPVVDGMFGFGGLGIGATYDARRETMGFALAPRLGVNVLVGRSGVLTPSVNLNWTSNQSVPTPQGTMVAVNTQWAANIGYTVMW